MTTIKTKNPFVGRNDNYEDKGHDFSNPIVKQFEYKEKVHLNSKDPHDFRIDIDSKEIDSINLDEKMQEIDSVTSLEALLARAAIAGTDMSEFNIMKPLVAPSGKEEDVVDYSYIPENANEVQNAITEQRVEAILNQQKQETEKQQNQNKPIQEMSVEELEALLAEKKGEKK